MTCFTMKVNEFTAQFIIKDLLSEAIQNDSHILPFIILFSVKIM